MERRDELEFTSDGINSPSVNEVRIKKFPELISFVLTTRWQTSNESPWTRLIKNQ